MAKAKNKKTTVGDIDFEALIFTAGDDPVLDHALVDADCIGTAAHAQMLAAMPLKPKLFSKADAKKITTELVKIMKKAAKGSFTISLADQDVHLAVERELTKSLGELGKKIHTGRSRNDQVAVDLRLFAKKQLLELLEESAALSSALIAFALKHAAVPMVGRTHMQPAMPSSVGLWASAHAESLMDDMASLMHVYELNDQSPLGAAAGYGVPLPLDRQKVADLLGFSRPCHNVLYANQARGKLEATILAALSQLMITLSRVSQDLILYSMPEFAYFTLPPQYGTGSSIMPQKNNPDVLELIRAKAAKVHGHSVFAHELIRSLPAGYNRDLQEAKGPFMDGLSVTRSCTRILVKVVKGTKVNEKALVEAFTPEVFATDRALAYVAQGMPFRDAYHRVKGELDSLEELDPYEAIASKTHLGATAGLNFAVLEQRIAEAKGFVKDERSAHNKAISKLLGVAYPLKA